MEVVLAFGTFGGGEYQVPGERSQTGFLTPFAEAEGLERRQVSRRDSADNRRERTGAGAVPG